MNCAYHCDIRGQSASLTHASRLHMSSIVVNALMSPAVKNGTPKQSTYQKYAGYPNRRLNGGPFI